MSDDDAARARSPLSRALITPSRCNWSATPVTYRTNVPWSAYALSSSIRSLIVQPPPTCLLATPELGSPSQTVLRPSATAQPTFTVDVAVATSPSAYVTVSFAVYDPGLAYVCRGFCSVDDVPSPKSHLYVRPPERAPLKAYVNGLFCTATEFAAGAGVAG